MNINKKRTALFAVVAVILLSLIIWTVWGNTALELNIYTVSGEKLPEAFDGFRIAHVSDLHNTEMGEDNGILLEKLREARPDIIAITGDMIDSRNTKVEIALEFAKNASEIAPCYYVTGNHESRVPEYRELMLGLTEAGIVVLEDEQTLIERAGETILLIGVDDPSFVTDYLFDDSEIIMENKLQTLTDGADKYTVLLSHRPELFDIYVDRGVNLVLSGHTHGGQVRLPFVGGLIAPDQGFFPEYDSGIYTEENTNMIVSRGIGNSIFPFRFNNRPEVILIELKSD